MKPISLHPVSTLIGVALAGLAFLAAGAQSISRVAEIPVIRCSACSGGFHPPVPVTKLEYFGVVNYAGRALAGDVVQVMPGERLILLGMNKTAKGLGSIGQASAFKLPLLEETFAENLLGDSGSPIGLEYLQGGVPAAFFDEGSYVFAEHEGLEDPTPRQEHARALIGYRVRAEE